MSKPAVGTIVYLEIGSPPMMVTSHRRDHLVSVEWFGKDGALHRDAFDPENIFVETPELADLRKRCANNMKAHMQNGTVEGIVPNQDAA